MQEDEMDRQKKMLMMYSILFIVLLLLALWVILPFLLTIIGGLIVAFIFYPVHKRLSRLIRSKGLSAFIITLLILVIFTVPLFLLAQAFVKESYSSYIIVKQQLSGSPIFSPEPCIEPGIRCDFTNWVQSMVPPSQLRFYFEDGIGKIAQWAISKANEVVLKIPSMFLQVFVMMFVIYYSLKEGNKAVRKFFSVVALKTRHSEEIKKKVKEMIGSTLYGMLILAAIQGLAAGIGFFIFGIRSPVLLGILTALAALIPIIGTALVWLPVVSIQIVNAFLSNDSTALLMSIGLLAYCIFPVSTIDNLVRHKIIGDKARTHPLLVLLGILGGLAAFGVFGILIGPIIVTLFVTFIDIYQEERLSNETES